MGHSNRETVYWADISQRLSLNEISLTLYSSYLSYVPNSIVSVDFHHPISHISIYSKLHCPSLVGENYIQEVGKSSNTEL